MTVTKSSQNNLTSPDGNSLAVFVDISDSTLKLKDINGNIDNFTTYLPPTPPTPLATGLLQLQGGVALSGTLTAVTDQNNNASQLKLANNLTQIAGTLQIQTDTALYLDVEDGSGNNRFTISREPASQQVNLDFASNPVGSTTTVGAIRTYVDGTNLSEVMTFREDGSIGVGTSSPVGLLDLYKAAAATRLAIRGDAGQNRLISYRTGAVQRFGLYVNNTAESGSNVGSDFAIRAYNDAGTLLNTPVFIKRSTGNVGVNTLTGTAKLQVVGSGSTSATTSLLVQNSAGTTNLSVNDAGNAFIGGNTLQFLNSTNCKIINNYGVMQLDNNGTAGVQLTFTNGAWGSSSRACFGDQGTAADASAQVEIRTTIRGFLPPRMTTAQKNAIATPAAGLMVYDTDLNKLCVRTAAAWETITSI